VAVDCATIEFLASWTAELEGETARTLQTDWAAVCPEILRVSSQQAGKLPFLTFGRFPEPQILLMWLFLAIIKLGPLRPKSETRG
jgi:hypothetical protein